MSKKLHWGSGLVVAFALFAAGVLTMVIVSMNREVDLVADDYYQQELKHEQQITSAKRSSALGDSVQCRMSGGTLLLVLPSHFHPDSTTGSLTFYRPADRKKDFVVPLVLSSENRQEVQVGNLEKGLWRVKVRWSFHREDFYREEAIIIQ
jgi:nitrogen fixation protein FixH